MAPKNTVLKKAFVLSVVFQFSHRFSPKPPQFSGVFPSLRGTSASRLTVERCKAWIKSSPKTTLEVSPPGTQLEGVNHQTKPGEDLDQPWPNEKEDRLSWKVPEVAVEIALIWWETQKCSIFQWFYRGSRCSQKGPWGATNKTQVRIPTFFFQEGEMNVASHFSGKARGKSSRSLAFHTHFTPKGIPGANGSWRNMRLAPKKHTFGDGAFHCQFDSLALGFSTIRPSEPGCWDSLCWEDTKETRETNKKNYPNWNEKKTIPPSKVIHLIYPTWNIPFTSFHYYGWTELKTMPTPTTSITHQHGHHMTSHIFFELGTIQKVPLKMIALQYLDYARSLQDEWSWLLAFTARSSFGI